MSSQNPIGWDELPYDVRVAGKEAAESNRKILQSHRPPGITPAVNEAVERIFQECFLIGWTQAYLFLRAKEKQP